jgi:hypothetical protein
MPDNHRDDDAHISTIEWETVRALAQATKEEVRVMQVILNKLDKSLFGNGQPGVIIQMQKKIDKHDKWIFAATAILIASHWLVDSGLVKHLFGGK